MIVNKRKQGYTDGWIYLWRDGVLMMMTLLLMLMMMTLLLMLMMMTMMTMALMMTLMTAMTAKNDRRDLCKMQKVDFF